MNQRNQMNRIPATCREMGSGSTRIRVLREDLEPELTPFPSHNGSRSISFPQRGYGSAFFSQALRKGAMVSMGIGKMVVEFFSAEISTRVCR